MNTKRFRACIALGATLRSPVTVTLAPGRHRLQLLLDDRLHIPHDLSVTSTPITITVE